MMIDARCHSDVLTLNNGAVPNVNGLSLAELQELVVGADVALVLEEGADVKGFMLGFLAANALDGFNFRWFRSRFDDFLYIDRVVVNPTYWRLGVGLELYACATRWCGDNGVGRMTCEVNDAPPNPGSHAFHRGLGFEPLESIDHPSGKRVCMYVRELA